MPRLSYVWRHVVITMHGAWLPGDPRGFRSRGHRLHSGGDYHHPPPEGEHAKLHRHTASLTDEARSLPVPLRAVVGLVLVDKLARLEIQSLALAVTATHAHLLAELPENPAEARKIVGRCKGYASFVVRAKLPGRFWAAGGAYKLIKDREHQRRAYRYILDHAEQGGWVWDFRRQRGG